MFYLTMHSTHFILRLYGVGHMVKDHSDSVKEGNMVAADSVKEGNMVKDHSDSEKGNLLP